MQDKPKREFGEVNATVKIGRVVYPVSREKKKKKKDEKRLLLKVS